MLQGGYWASLCLKCPSSVGGSWIADGAGIQVFSTGRLERMVLEEQDSTVDPPFPDCRP